MAAHDDRRAQDQQKTGQGAQPSSAAKSQEQEETPLPEKLVGLLGLLLVLGVIGYLVYQSLFTLEPPAILLEVTNVVAYEAGYRVEIQVSNQGGSTVAGLVVTGMLLPKNQSSVQNGGSQPVEEAQTTFDYVPPRSRREGGLFFHHNPLEYDLELDAGGYTQP